MLDVIRNKNIPRTNDTSWVQKYYSFLRLDINYFFCMPCPCLNSINHILKRKPNVSTYMHWPADTIKFHGADKFSSHQGKKNSWWSPVGKSWKWSKKCLLTPRRFGHDVDFDRLAKWNGPFNGRLWWWEAFNAVAPSQFERGGRRGERGWGGAVGQQETHLDLRRLCKGSRGCDGKWTALI